MATTEELRAQIHALIEQIIDLQNQIGDVLNDSQKLDLIKSIVGDKTIESKNVISPSLEKKFNEEINLASLSGHDKINEKETRLIIKFNDTRLSSDIKKSLSIIDEIGIEIFDNDKIEKELDTVYKKYAEDFKSGRLGERGGVGGPISDFVLEALMNVVIYWILPHIVNDMDNALWGKIKEAFWQIFKSTKKTKEKEDKNIVILTNTAPQIIFILPLKIEDDFIQDRLDEMIKMTKEIVKNNKECLAYKYTYKPNILYYFLQFLLSS